MQVIRIIYPSSIGSLELLHQRLQHWKDIKQPFLFEPYETDSRFSFLAGSSEYRAKMLWNALTEKESQIVWAGRGGYGASDLLPLIPWEDLKHFTPKPVIGFSDFSAILTALWSLSHWNTGVHGSMPGSSLWQEDSLKNIQNISGTIMLTPLNHMAHKASHLEGVLKGGCLSVLTNLIGTPYFADFVDDTLLFLEDVQEPIGRILRYVQQWYLSGKMKKVVGVIFGEMISIKLEHMLNVSERFSCPVWYSPTFGHGFLNRLIPCHNQSRGVIDQHTLWF